MAAKSESKYERLRKIGIGSYGIVFKCVNRQTGQIVAIKRYSENDTDPIIRKIAMREVRMLRQLRHPNLINLIEVFRRKRRLHLVFDYCELTVLDVIEKYTINCPPNLVKKIIWQTVNAINYCHTHNCIHRDIKPENILINQAGIVKLCDFGFARTVTGSKSIGSFASFQNNTTKLQLKREALVLNPIGSDKENNIDELDMNSSLASDRQALTEYVATRWYRAPELLIGEIYYDIKIDIWALGCVAAELMRGEPIWPGKTDLDQLNIIKSSLGQLTNSQTHTLINQAIYDQASIEKLLQSTPSSSDSIEKKLPARFGQSGIEFVSACLQMDPAQRLASDDLLKHPFIYSARMSQFMKDPGSKKYISEATGSTSSIALTSTNTRSSRLNSHSLMLAATATPEPFQSRLIKRMIITRQTPDSSLPSLSSKSSSIPRAISRPTPKAETSLKQRQNNPNWNDSSSKYKRKQPSRNVANEASKTKTIPKPA